MEWLCAPRFDSDACFASLIGYDEHGHWSIRPTTAVRDREQRYRDDHYHGKRRKKHSLLGELFDF